MWKQTVSFSPSKPPTHTPTPPTRHPRLMDRHVYGPHAELRKYPLWYNFFQKRKDAKEELLIHIFFNIIDSPTHTPTQTQKETHRTWRTRTLMFIYLRSRQSYIVYVISQCDRGGGRCVFEMQAKVFQAWGESWQFQTSRLSILIRPRRYGGLSKLYLEGGEVEGWWWGSSR